MKRLRRYWIELVALALLAVALAGYQAMAQDSGSNVELKILPDSVSVDFPTVNLAVSVFQGGKGVTGLTATNFEISGEPYENLTVTEESTGAINLGVVIDVTAGTDLNLVRNVLNSYFQNETYFRDGDQVWFVLASSGSSPSITKLTTRDEISSFINRLAVSNDPGRYSRGLEPLLTEFANNQISGQIIVIGSLFYFTTDGGQTATLAGRAWNDYGVRVHAVQAHGGSRTQFTAGLQQVATSGNGNFVEYRGDQHAARIQELFNGIQTNRVTYQLHYDTLSAQAGERSPEVIVGFAGGRVSNSFSYTAPPIREPQVQIISPSPNSPILRSLLDPQDPTSLTPTVQVIQARVSFPDTFARNIVSAALTVDIAGNLVRQEFTDLEVDGNGNFELEWDLTRAGSVLPGSIPVVLQVEVTDKYSLVGLSDRLSVSIENPPEPVPDTGSSGLPVGIPGSNALPTQVSPANNTTGEGQLPAPASASAETGSPATTTTSSSTSAIEEKKDNNVYIAIGGGIAAFFILMVLVLRRRRRKGGGGAVRTYGDLEIIRGPYAGQLVELDSSPFTIGREEEAGVDFATPGFAHVSARHCSIIYKNGKFVIIDHRSTNGTFVDGQKLPAEVETTLQQQSIVRLGHDPQGSVEFRFYPAQELIAAATPFKGRTLVDNAPLAGAAPYGHGGQATRTASPSPTPPGPAPYSNVPPPYNAPYQPPPAPAQPGNIWQEHTQPYTPSPGQPGGNPPPPPAPYGPAGQRPNSDWDVDPNDQSWLDG